MARRILLLLGVLALAVPAALAQSPAKAAQTPDGTWTFSVSGDSRNCGDVVMPAIAASAVQHKPAFYWHLGDLRAIYTFDEDMLHQPERKNAPLTISGYLAQAWPDFIENQIRPFASVPFFVGIGNHELVAPKTREEFIVQFADWLNAPPIQQQRLKDSPRDHRVRTYYHWVERGVDFINLDNASGDQFDAEQMRWLDGLVKRVAKDSSIKTVVVGMHAALPDSISIGHSMQQSPAGVESGRIVYKALLDLRDHAGKRVYVLASHSHFFMDGVFNTEALRANGGVLPGWIVGTAGAVRYVLPPNAKDAKAAETNVYGYLLGTVQPSGEISFGFHRVTEADTPASVRDRYGAEFVHWCHAENSQARQP
jgi:hypothetical protein